MSCKLYTAFLLECSHWKWRLFSRLTISIRLQQVSQVFGKAKRMSWQEGIMRMSLSFFFFQCRYTLQYTYPYAYYMESGSRKKLVRRLPMSFMTAKDSGIGDHLGLLYIILIYTEQKWDKMYIDCNQYFCLQKGGLLMQTCSIPQSVVFPCYIHFRQSFTFIFIWKQN